MAINSDTINNTRFNLDKDALFNDVFNFLKIACFNYSHTPNSILKKKYYDLISNIPIYYPESEFSSQFLHLLNTNPINTFLDSKKDLLRWLHYIENNILKTNGKPTQNYDSWVANYQSLYEKPYHYNTPDNGIHFLYNKYVWYGLLLLSLLGIIKYNLK